MKININNPVAFGYDTTDKNGKRTFEALRITRNKDDFLSFAQYLLDSMPDPSNVIMVDINSQLVIDFYKLATGIGLKSKRYPH